MSKSKYMKSTFLPRSLPVVLLFNNGEIIGPFCQHCGWRQSDHGPGDVCLAVMNVFFTPNCGCHAIDCGPAVNGGRIVRNHNGIHIKEPV